MRTLFAFAATALVLSLGGCSSLPADAAAEGTDWTARLEHPASDDPVFLLHQVGRDHSEGVSVLDLDADGDLDIASGAYWYQAPDWSRRAFREAQVFGEYVANSGEFALDADHDGDLDIVSAGWQEDGVFWYENPGQVGPRWAKHLITPSKATEGLWRADIDGDGVGEVFASHYEHSEVFYISFSGPSPKKVRVGGVEGDGHGLGVGDIDGDGKPDLVTTRGWYRQQSPTEWTFQPEFELGEVGFGVQVFDVNQDGANDLIFGRGHSYGLYWAEQTSTGGKRGWKRRRIDGSYSQLHNTAMADLDGDGTPELITGKRYRGHNGDDPGGYEPLALFYYKIDTETASFERFPIAYNSPAGAGTQFVVVDMDGDTDLDIVTAGKSGQFWFENLSVDSVTRETREKDLLLETDWPFSE